MERRLCSGANSGRVYSEHHRAARPLRHQHRSWHLRRSERLLRRNGEISVEAHHCDGGKPIVFLKQCQWQDLSSMLVQENEMPIHSIHYIAENARRLAEAARIGRVTISEEHARILDGDFTVASDRDQGSVFYS